MKQSEGGFILSEIAVTVSVVALIAGAAAMMVTQTAAHNKASADLVEVNRQTQNLSYYLRQDLLKGVLVSTTDDPGTEDSEFVIVVWRDWETGWQYKARYVWQTPGLVEKKVVRKFTVTDLSGSVKNSASTLIAAHINTVALAPASGTRWQLNIGTHCGDRILSRSYYIDRRLEE